MYVPTHMWYDKNGTLMLNVEKRTMVESSENDAMSFRDIASGSRQNGKIDADLLLWSKNISSPFSSSRYDIHLYRKLSLDDISNTADGKMPGFRLTWKYDSLLDPEPQWKDNDITQEFIRYVLNQT